MQYLKDEVKNRIVSAALKEFGEKGFHEASMRQIAKNSGVALGNLYRYFESKDQLFNEVLDPAYREITLVMGELKSCEAKKTAEYLESIVEKVMEVLKEYKLQLMILVDKSSGTKYAGTKEYFVLYVKKSIEEMLLPALEANRVQIKDDFIFYVMASTFMEGLFIILKQYDDENKIKNLIRQLIIIYFNDIDKRFI